MTTEFDTGAAQAASNPLPVSRGLKLHNRENEGEKERRIGFIGIDSLYVVVEYPHQDVFDFWSAPVTDFTDPSLHEGIPYEDMVLRRGGLGYKLSVWDGDARLYITDRVNDAFEGGPHEGHGMGVMLQLGPLWLRQFGEHQGVFAPNILKRNVWAQLILFGIEDPDLYPKRLNRLDLTVDLLGADLNELEIERWREGWVGFAKPKGIYFMSKTGQVEGFSVGSSQGAVRFKAYDKVAEATKRGKLAFWRSVWGLVPLEGQSDSEGEAEEADDIPVTRLEWTVKCYQARFANLRYLDELTFERFLALLNYVVLKWGQLRVPSEDTNTARWPLAPFWSELIGLIDQWSFHYHETAQREYVFEPDIKDEYLRFVTGTLAGLQVRVGYDKGDDAPSSLAQALSFLHHEGYTMDDIQTKAKDKWRVFSRLARRANS